MKYTKEHAQMATDIAQHLETLYHLVVDNGYRTILDLGVRDGHSTVALLEAVHETKGHLYSVDIVPCPLARERMSEYGLDARWTFFEGDDVLWGKAWDPAVPVDMVFIDTAHQHAHTTREIEVFEPLVRPGGLLAFHDTVTFCHDIYGPIEIFRRGKPNYTWENHHYCNGLGILRKPR